jgi:hypothetical protein
LFFFLPHRHLDPLSSRQWSAMPLDPLPATADVAAFHKKSRPTWLMSSRLQRNCARLDKSPPRAPRRRVPQAASTSSSSSCDVPTSAILEGHYNAAIADKQHPLTLHRSLCDLAFFSFPIDIGDCRMDFPGPTASVGTRTDYSVGPWDYPTCAAQHLLA